MENIKHFYADPEGNIRDNESISPIDILQERHGPGIILRFSLDISSNTFYVQDPSVKNLMASGDKNVWHYLNQCLRFAKSCHGMGLPNRAYGCPRGCPVRRRLSDYKGAWADLSDFLPWETGRPPTDLAVIEHSDPEREFPPTFMQDKGDFLGESLDEPFILLERNGLAGPDSDSSHEHLSNLLRTFYLRNLPSVHGPTQEREAGTMTALEKDGKFGIFKTEADRETLFQMTGGKYIQFCYLSSEKRMVLLDRTPLETYRNKGLSEILDQSLENISRASGVPRKDIIVTFDHGLGNPYSTRLSRYRVPWNLLEENQKDFPVIEVPLDLPGDSIVLRSASDEKSMVPELLKYRILHGLDVEHPFLAVNNRRKASTCKYRAMMEALEEPQQEPTLDVDVNYMPEKDLEEKARFVMELGLSPRETVDVLSGRHVPRRFCHRKIINKILRDMFRERHRQARKETRAVIGPTYDINSWWHIGLQEELNQARHTNDQSTQKLEPFNLRKKKTKHRKDRTTEELLDKDRDKDFGYMKTTEQLLKENRI